MPAIMEHRWVTSLKFGISCILLGLSASKEAANIGKIAFLAPLTLISPFNVFPPVIINFSTFKSPFLFTPLKASHLYYMQCVQIREKYQISFINPILYYQITTDISTFIVLPFNSFFLI